MDENGRKHLEFIQNVISRLATNCFLMKGWALTIAVASSGYGVAHERPGVIAVGVLPTAGFWFLDSYFLWQERLFRGLYDDVRTGAHPDAFTMDTARYREKEKWGRAVGSITLVTFYGFTVLGSISLALVL